MKESTTFILRHSMGRWLLFAAALFSVSGQTLPNAGPFQSAQVQFLDSNGRPLNGGKLYTCVAGLSCPGNPQATYTDSTASVQNANPIILDSAGRAQVWLGPQAYRLVLQNRNSVLQWTQDNVVDTTLYFANYVKTAGTATVISYLNPATGAVARTVSDALSERTSVKDFGCVGDGATDDTACITAAFNANVTLFFPPGTYLVNNNPNPLTFTSWTGSAIFDPTAKILCNYAHQGCFEFINGTNNVLENFSYTYGVSEPTDQCADHGGGGNCWGLAFSGAVNLTVINFSLLNGYGIGLNLQGGSTQPCTNPKIIGARIVNTSRDGIHIQNCANWSVSDAYVENSGDDSFGFLNTSDRPDVNGGTATNVQSVNSLGGCFSISGKEQVLTNFVCKSPSSFGITISFPGFLQRPWSGMIAHGIITNVSFRAGGICPCGAPGLEFFNGTGVVKFDDISIDTVDGVGFYFSTFMETPPLAPEVQLSNIRVSNVGLQAGTSTGGYCYLLNNVTTMTLSNLYADSCPWDGFSIFATTNLFASGLRVRNASTAGVAGPGLGHAVYLTNIGHFMVSDVQVMDTQGTGTSLIVGETSTLNAGIFNGVEYFIASGTPSFQTSSSDVQYSNVNVNGVISNGRVTWGSTSFVGQVDITANSATPMTVSTQTTSTFGASIVIDSKAPHFQAVYGLRDQGTLKWSLVKGTDTEMIPQYFALFDALNNLDTILVNPNSPVAGYKERFQIGPSGTTLVWMILPVYANNAAAVAGGLAVGDLYRESSGIVHVVI